MSSSVRRVVITGVGLISPLGNDKESLWDGLQAGRSAVGPITVLPGESPPVGIAAEADQFIGKIDNFGPLEKNAKKAIRKGLKLMCRECQMGVATAQLALSDAGIASENVDPERVGVSFGSDYMVTLPDDFLEGVKACGGDAGHFEFDQWAGTGLAKMSPLWLLKYLPNMPASHIGIYNNFCGPSNSITMREASGNLVIGEALEIIIRGNADVMLCGSTGTRLNPSKIVHAAQQEELAAGDGDPAAASRPFDLNRTGMVLGEGAATVVLEELTLAEARGATIYGEVLAGSSSAAAGRKLVARRDVAMKNALAGVLKNARLSLDEIGHLTAHGLSTRPGDIEEARAVNQVFAGRNEPLPIVAPKSHFGNLGAGSGVVELIASLLALTHNQLFPILNYETPDPACPITAVTDTTTSPGETFINLSTTPQAQAAAVLIRRYR